MYKYIYVYIYIYIYWLCPFLVTISNIAHGPRLGASKISTILPSCEKTCDAHSVRPPGPFRRPREKRKKKHGFLVMWLQFIIDGCCLILLDGWEL